MIKIIRNGLKISADNGMDESQGSANVKILLQSDDTYLGYTQQMHIGYYDRFIYKKRILEFLDGYYIIPYEAFENTSFINLSVLLTSGKEELMTNQITYLIKQAPRGSMPADNDPTTQQLVMQLVQTSLNHMSDFMYDVSSDLSMEINRSTNKDSELSSRIDSFTRLEEGSTTGDAELIDGRVGYDGTTYKNIGGAIRNQVSKLSSEIDNPSIYHLDMIQQTMGVTNLWNQGLIEKEYDGTSPWQYASKEIPIESGEYTVYVGINGIEGASFDYVSFGYDLQNKVQNGEYREFKKLQKIVVDGNNAKFNNKLVVKIQISSEDNFPAKKNYYIDNIIIFKGNILDKSGIPLSFIDGYSLINNKLDKSPGKNLFNNNVLKENCFIDEYGSATTNDYSSKYFISDYILAKENTPYSLSPLNTTNTGIAFYDRNKTFLKYYKYDTVGDTYYLSPQNTEYVRFTGEISKKDVTQLEEGEIRTNYEPYYDYKPSYDNSKRIDKIEKELSLLPKEFLNKLFKKQQRKDVFNSKETITFTNIPNCKQNNVISFYGNIVNGFNGKIGISHGKIEYRCGFIEVDNTNLYVYRDELNIQDTFAHGLTINNFISIVVNVNYGNKAKVTVSTIGGKFEKEIQWNGCINDVMFENTNLSLKNVVATFTLNDLDKDLWCFGDSYFDFWAKEMYDLGYGNFYADAFSGRNSQQAIISLKNALMYKIPKKIYWCLGMNDKDIDAINETWLTAIEELKTICNEKGIELILCTIPNTPIIDNSYKNQYIYDSGYEYVDINKIVGAYDSVNWYSGLLSSDNVHPTNEGASVIINTNISSFPEMKNQ